MPSAYRFADRSVQRVSREWIAAIERDTSHPCIVAWVPINESWGVPNLPTSAAERHYVQGLYHLTKTLDPTRPVIGNDGWESVATDIIGIHDYDSDPERIAKRYRADEMLPRLFKRERPGGRLLVLGGDSPHEQPVMLTEFGGIALSNDQKAWGYSRAAVSPRVRAALHGVAESRELAQSVRGLLLHAVRRHLSGKQRPAVCGSNAEISARSNGPRNDRRRAASGRGRQLGSHPHPVLSRRAGASRSRPTSRD